MRLALIAISAIVMLPAYAEELVLAESSLSEVDMEGSRGGQYYFDIDSVAATSDIEGVSAGNVANDTITGSNIIAAGALLQSSGLTNVIQNSGNNVLIQNATVVNITLE